MSNLPISTNTPQPSGAPTKPAQANNPANEQESAPFANLLARQIGESDPSAPHTAPLVTITDSAPAPKQDALDSNNVPLDPGSVIAITPADPTNALAAIMLQLPQEIRPQASADAPVARQALAIDNAALNAVSGTHAIPVDTANTSPLIASPLAPRSAVASNLNAAELTQHSKVFTAPLDRSNADQPKLAIPAGTADKQIAATGLAQDAPKFGESSANLPQPGQNSLPANIAMAMHGATTNATTSNRAVNDSLAVNTPLASNAWADDFSQQISWMSTQKIQVAELRLNPPNLGPLDVTLTVTDKQVTAQFSSPHGAVRDAVENALPKLREIFADNGIMLGNTTVSDQTPRERNAAGFMNQGSGAQRNADDDGSPSQIQAAGDTPIPVVRRHLGIVDTFA